MNRFSHLKITAMLLVTVFVPSAVLAWQAIEAMANENSAVRMVSELRDDVAFEDFDTGLRDTMDSLEDHLARTLSQCVTVEALEALAQESLQTLPFDQAVVTDRVGLHHSSFSLVGSLEGAHLVWPLFEGAEWLVERRSRPPPWFGDVTDRTKFGTWLSLSMFAATYWVGEGWPGSQYLVVAPGTSAASGFIILRLQSDRAREHYLEPNRRRLGGRAPRCGLVPELPRAYDDVLIRDRELDAPFKGLYPALLKNVEPVSWKFSRDLVIWLTVVLMAVGAVLTLATVVRGMRLAQLQSDFVSTVSHELRTPLTSIAMFVEMLQMERYDDEEEKEEYLSIVARETDRLKRLIERVLNLSKLEKGTKRFEFQPENVGEVVMEAVKTFREQHRGTSYELELTILQNLSPVLMDRDSIGEVLLNLLSNALKYSGEDPRIRLTIRERRTRVLVEVEDNGIGIRRRDRKRIFYKFFRADNSLAREVEGTGIGLAISRSIALAHRGDLTVTSSVGKGSRFTLSLPKSLVDIGHETDERAEEKSSELETWKLY